MRGRKKKYEMICLNNYFAEYKAEKIKTGGTEYLPLPDGVKDWTKYYVLIRRYNYNIDDGEKDTIEEIKKIKDSDERDGAIYDYADTVATYPYRLILWAWDNLDKVVDTEAWDKIKTAIVEAIIEVVREEVNKAD